MVTGIFKAEMKSAGKATSNNICGHFAMSRPDLFHIVKWVLFKYCMILVMIAPILCGQDQEAQEFFRNNDDVWGQPGRCGVRSVQASYWQHFIVAP